MLSFTRDDKDKGSKLKDHDTGAEPKGVAQKLSGGDQDYLVTAEHGRNAKRSTIVLVVLFCFGAACLWFMIKKTSPEPASASVNSEEMQIEAAIMQLAEIRIQMDNRMQDVGRFYQFSEVEQVDVTELKKNPFAHTLSLGDFKEAPEKLNNLDIDAKKELQLWSIIESELGNCCMINDKLLYEGDSIKGFKVNKIGSRFVELLSGESRIVLKMPD